jgi:photosystem II stability/assembly factor-like uncharacterized protein
MSVPVHFRSRRPWLVTAVLLAAVAAIGAVHTGAQAPAGANARIDALFKDLKWRNIGPANMAGRVTDIEALESNPAVVYVAAASGGVWKSVNAGTTWEPIFTNYKTSSIGDIGIYQKDPNIIWVGTGEGCVRNSAEWGDGVYKSTDAGKTFVSVGLSETHHIARIITHPTNPDIVYVAAQGHLWGYNPERGVFKTVDGGKTWKKLANGLPNDNKTGAGDLIMDPANPNILYANMWERIRKPYVFESGGANSGLYKSTNGGDSWTKLSGGLPTGSVGKIGLAIFRRNSKILTAIVEAPRSTDPNVPGAGIYRSEDAGVTWKFMNASADRPFYYNHIYLDPNVATRLYVLQVPARVSEDGGKTFPRTLPGIEGDFHAMWIDPSNSDRFYIANDKGASVTYDGGRNFIMFDNMDIGQFYAVTADNRDPYYVYGGLQDSGNWGGPSNSRDYNGILGDHWFKFHSGDGFHTTVDPDDWRIVYTETQNGGIRRLDSTFRQQGNSVSPRPATILNYADVTAAEGKAPQFRYNWSSPLILSPHDSKTLYLGSNRLVRSTDRGETWEIISPDLSTNDPELTSGPAPAMGERGGAENHATIISVVESPVMAGLIWAGTDDGNVQVTRDGGKTWTNTRPNIPASLVPVRTWVSRVEPSHFEAGTAYVSFDGHRSDNMNSYILKTTDFGKTWTSLTAAFPAKQPVYVVKEDLKNPGLLFAGTEYGVQASIDGGATWRPLTNGGFPTVAVHDLVIHPREGDLIAATHGRSLWILDDITPLQQLTPAVLASDVHLFKNKVATIWNAVSRGATRGHLMFQGRNPLTIAARPPANSPTELANSATVTFYLNNAPAAPVQMEISSLDGSRTVSLTVPATQGINRYFWNMRFAAAGGGGGGRGGGRAGGPPNAAAGAVAGGAAGGAAAAGAAGGGQRGGGGGRAGGAAAGGAAAGGEAGDAPPPQANQGAAEPGSYRVKITVDGKSMTTTLIVRADPGIER